MRRRRRHKCQSIVFCQKILYLYMPSGGPKNLQCTSYNEYTRISTLYLNVWCCYMYLYILLSFETVGRNSFFHRVNTAVLFRLLAPNFYIVKLGFKGAYIYFLIFALKDHGCLLASTHDPYFSKNKKFSILHFFI